MSNNKIVIASLILILFGGCAINTGKIDPKDTGKIDPKDIISESSQIQDFLNSFPNSDIKTIYMSESNTKKILSSLVNDCGPQMIAKDYYKSTIVDLDTKSTLVVWIDAKTGIIDCLIKKGSVKKETTQFNGVKSVTSGNNSRVNANMTNATYVSNVSNYTYVANVSNATYVSNLSNYTYVANVSNATYVSNLSNYTYVANVSNATYVSNLSNYTYVANVSNATYVSNASSSGNHS